jgi:hypothetical protein
MKRSIETYPGSVIINNRALNLSAYGIGMPFFKYEIVLNAFHRVR